MLQEFTDHEVYIHHEVVEVATQNCHRKYDLIEGRFHNGVFDQPIIDGQQRFAPEFPFHHSVHNGPRLHAVFVAEPGAVLNIHQNPLLPIEGRTPKVNR